MRIGIEAQRIFRKKKHGMDIYALELIKQLQALDHINEYFVFVKPGPDKCLQESHNFHIIEISGLTYADWEQISLPLAASKLNLDVLHCTSNTAPLFGNTPLLLTLHDIIYLNKSFSGGSWYQKLGHYYRKWIVPSAFKKATRVFTVSNFEKTQIENQFGKSNKVDVVYNGVNKKFRIPYEEDLAKIRLAYNLPESYIFFLGNTVPKKNMPGMLKAYDQYCIKTASGLPLVVAETSTEELNAMLTQLKLNHLSNQIFLTGYVNHCDLPGLYAGAEAFIYPSLRESFGIPIIEAMACGTKVITSNTSSMPEVAKGFATLIDPTDINNMSDKLEEILVMDEKQSEIMISDGLDHAASFTWTNTAKSTLSAYEMCKKAEYELYINVPQKSTQLDIDM